MIKIGDTLDNTYFIEERIGSGGSGIIYKAYHYRLKKSVVIKQIKSELRGKINERSEVDILKNLKHTYLPQVYDFIADEDDIYTVMDYIPGSSLFDELKKRKRFPQKKVVKWAIQLCEALSYLHSRTTPIIHSDIKPDNIMLTPDDNICLIDFNVSLLFSNEVNTVGFSEGYSPPEQVCIFNVLDRMALPNKTAYSSNDTDLITLDSGRSNSCVKQLECKIDERSDIYSLGATLYHLLTGEIPENSNKNIIPLESYNIKIGQSLKQIIYKAMNKDIECRYKSADDMLQALNNISINDCLYEKKAKRKRRILICLIIILLLIIFSICYVFILKNTKIG